MNHVGLANHLLHVPASRAQAALTGSALIRRSAPSPGETYMASIELRHGIRIECMVRMRISPIHRNVSPSRCPFSLRMVYMSVSTCVGCSPQPSPQLITGTLAHLAASAGAPCWKCRMAITSP